MENIGLSLGPGQIIAVAFQNSLLQLTNAHSGKVVHNINCAIHSESQICCLGWSINSTRDQEIELSIRNLGPDTSLDEIFNRGNPSLTHDEVPDLPSDLAFIDVESMLPKLSALAPGGAEYEDIPNANTVSSLIESMQR